MMSRIKKIENKNNNKKRIIKFIKKYDDSFDPAISKQVDIEKYAEKVLSKGHFLGVIEDSKIEGLIGFYCNDKENKCAYITYLAVGEGSRGKGIGSKLVNACNSKCSKEGMEKTRVQTSYDNASATKMYKKIGFRVENKYVNNFSTEKVVLEKVIK
jgi:ribosomal protein S18 acetylase RimI-like enzyme